MASLYLGQAEQDHANIPLFWGNQDYLEGATIAQDAARAIPLADMTLMAKVAISDEWTPLQDVDPATTPGSMLTGAMGDLDTFQAVSDGSFKIGIDGETAILISALDFSGLEAPSATGAVMTTGAFGTTLAALQAITDGEFAITVDDQALSITGLDFSDIQAPTDTAAKCVCGANGTNLAGWAAVSNGGFAITVDGTLYTFTDVDFTGALALGDVAVILNGHVGGAGVTCKYNAGTDVYEFYSTTTGRLSTITAVVTGGTTDISGAGFLNGLTGTATLTQGTGGDGHGTTVVDVINEVAAGRFTCVHDAASDAYLFLSPRRGAMSTITALSVSGGGTDISGAGYFNGLTGTAVLVQGTGDAGDDRNISDVINEKAAGRFTAIQTATKMLFVSPTEGVQSAVSVLTAGTAGTDISGASYLNGLTGTGVVAAGTGLDGSELPLGIYHGGSIPAATLVAGSVTGEIYPGGELYVNEDALVLENSLDLDSSIIPSRGVSIRTFLHNIGIKPQTTKDATAQI